MKYKKKDAKEYAFQNMKGIWAAALNPFSNDFSLDEKGLRSNFRHWIDDLEIDGFFISGKQGEFFSMSLEERKKSFLIAVLSLPLIILYPLAKRYTKYPQFALGIVFSWGVPLGWSATNTDFNLEVVIMYLGTIAWVFGYDTIYSIQDKKDDMQLRVHSTSLTFKNKTKNAVSIAYFLCFILFININWSFLWIIGILLAGLHMIWQIKNLDLDSPSKALKLFKSNRDLGLIISLFAFLDLYFRV